MVDLEFEADKYSIVAERYANNGNLPRAHLKFTKFAKLNPNNPFLDPFTYCRWAECLSLQYKYPEAIKRYQRAIQINPKHFKAFNGWGVCLLKMGKYDDAKQKFNRALEISPKDWRTNLNIIIVLLLKGNEKEALELLKSFKEEANYYRLEGIKAEFQKEWMKIEDRIPKAKNKEEVSLIEEYIKAIRLFLKYLSSKQNT